MTVDKVQHYYRTKYEQLSVEQVRLPSRKAIGKSLMLERKDGAGIIDGECVVAGL